MTAPSWGGVDLDLLDFFDGVVDPDDSLGVTQAIRRAEAALAAQGGGRLHLPPGRWLVRRLPDEPLAAAVVVRTAGITLRGAGVRATILKFDGRQDGHVIAVLAPGVTIERMTVAGGLDREPRAVREGQELAGRNCHGISIRDCPAFTLVRDVLVEDVISYGIGCIMRHRGETAEPDPFCHVRLHNVTLRRIGDDAIDFKIDVWSRNGVDQGPDPAGLGFRGPRAFVRNVAVADHSALGPNASDDDIRGENGLDARGQVHAENVEVIRVRPGEFAKPGGAGLTFRDETGPGGGVSSASHGRGGQWSTLQNYFVSRRPALPGEEAGVGGGVLVTDLLAAHVSISNGGVTTLHDRVLGPLGNGDYRYRRSRWARVRAREVSDRVVPYELRLRLHRARTLPVRVVHGWVRRGKGQAPPS